MQVNSNPFDLPSPKFDQMDTDVEENEQRFHHTQDVFDEQLGQDYEAEVKDQADEVWLFVKLAWEYPSEVEVHEREISTHVTLTIFWRSQVGLWLDEKLGWGEGFFPSLTLSLR